MSTLVVNGTPLIYNPPASTLILSVDPAPISTVPSKVELPGKFPIIVLLLQFVSMLHPAPSPIAIFELPFDNANVPVPIPIFLLPVVLLPKDCVPIAILLEPLVFFNSDELPIAMLFTPVCVKLLALYPSAALETVLDVYPNTLPVTVGVAGATLPVEPL